MLAGGALPADAPTSIQAILLARLDRLTAEVKSVVQAAAVLGREFEVRVLSEMLRSEIDLPGRVRQAEQEAIWSALDELRYLFRHALLRDAAYEMQLRARLRQLHSLAAEAIQQVFTPDLSPYFADLAYHCDKAEDYPQAIDWYHRAAKRAADLYANEEAWGYCSRALQLADEPGVSIIANQKRFDLLVLRESILDRMGHRAEQWADLQAMEAIAQDDRQRCKVLQRKILRCRVLSERPEEKALIEALKQQAQALADPSWLAEAYYTEGLYYTLIDEKSLALSSLEKSLALRQETGDIAGQMDCCCALAIIYLKLWQYAEAMQWIEKAQASSVNQARPEQLALVLRAAATAGLIHKDNRMCYRYATQLLDLATKIGEHKRKASAHFLRGQALCAMFRIEEGFKELNWCLQNEQELGNTHSMSLVLGEIAYQYMSLGDFDLAKDYFQRSMKIDQETNYPHGYCTSLLNLSFIALCQEDAVTAKELYQQGLAVARELGNDYLEAIAIGNLGEAEQLLGEYEASLPHTYRAIELLEKLDQPAEVAIMQIDLAITYLKMGNFELALQFAEKLIAAFPRADADLNDAQRLLWAAARVFHALGQTERAAATLADAYQLYCNKLQQIPEPRMQAAFRQLKFNRQIAAAFEEARWPE
jgi:tetratricopeptide (TPR) repeat protein